MRKTHLLIVSVFALLLVGAGCNNSSNTSDNTMSDTKTNPVENNKTTPESDNVIIKNFTSSTALTLSSEETSDKGTVSLSWSAPQDLKDKTEAWRLLYGKDIDPSFPTSWYFERGPSFFDKVWTGLPSGPGHIRVCAVINDVCEVFSNDLEVDIK